MKHTTPTSHIERARQCRSLLLQAITCFPLEFVQIEKVDGFIDLMLDGVDAGADEEHVFGLRLLAKSLDVALTHDELRSNLALLR